MHAGIHAMPILHDRVSVEPIRNALDGKGGVGEA